MPKFKELYTYCQTLVPKISTRLIEKKVLEISGKPVKILVGGLDLTKMRGYFISMSNKEAPLVKQNGTNIIVLGRGLNECWDRFIKTKELLHLLDDDDVSTNTGDNLDELLTDFEVHLPSLNRSKQYVSEVNCLVMAIACLCPEKNRLEFQQEFKRGHTDHYGIALKLKIPELHVRVLLRDDFKDLVDKIIDS